MNFVNERLEYFIKQNENFYKWLVKANEKIVIDPMNRCFCAFYKQLFSFCVDEKQTKMRINISDGFQRKFVHNRCDQLNLQHILFDENGIRGIDIEKIHKINFNKI